MELQSLLRPNADSPTTRRVFVLIPFALLGTACDRAFPNPSENGTGDLVTIVLFSDSGKRLQTIKARKLVKSLAEWRKQLSPEPFAVTRRQATEFAFHNLYWNSHKAGIYRCICCGSALFSSSKKYDSDTGWPSFTEPIASENVATRPDHSLDMERTEVLCRKCDAHIGHLFSDGPPPFYNRYCLNSAALRFVSASLSS